MGASSRWNDILAAVVIPPGTLVNALENLDLDYGAGEGGLFAFLWT